MIQNLAQNFINYLDGMQDASGRSLREGLVSRSEYEAYLKSQKLPLNMATNALTIFDTVITDGFISEEELINGYTRFDRLDTGVVGTLDFEELINLQNRLSGITIDTTISSYQYNSLYSNAVNFFKAFDKDENGELNLEEIRQYLRNNKLDESKAQAVLDFYKANQADQTVNLLEYVRKSTTLDTDKNGQLTAFEMIPLQNIFSNTQISQATTTAEQYNALISNAQNFIRALDTEKGADGKLTSDGKITLEEVKTYLRNNKLDENKAQAFLEFYQAGESLDLLEYVKKSITIDTNKNGQLTAFEMIPLQNILTGNPINQSTTNEKQYNSLLPMAQSFIRGMDTEKNAEGKLTFDGKLTREEIRNFLDSKNLRSGDADVQRFIDGFKPGASELNLVDVLKKYIAADVDKDGKITRTYKDENGELVEGEDVYAFALNVTALTNNEIAAKNFIKAVDGTKNAKGVKEGMDGFVNFSEYKAFLTSNKMPADKMALKAFELYDTDGDKGRLSRDELVAAYNKFDLPDDKGVRDNTLSFSESIAFQNSLADLDFATDIDQAQYTNLYKTGQTFMKFDVNNDGYVDTEEYRAALLAPNAKTGATQPEHYAENLVMLFDKEQTNSATGAVIPKDGKIDLFEYMQGVMTFDKDNKGTLDAVEALNLKNKLDNTRLFNSANEVFNANDYDNDKNLNLAEVRAYLKSQDIPESLAEEFLTQFNTFDKNENSISRLELMQAFKKFDLNNNNTLDADEKLRLFAALSQGAAGVNVNENNLTQYTTMLGALKTYVSELDKDGNNLLNATELKAYFKDQNLPDYLVNNLITEYGNVADQTINLQQLMEAQMEVDANGSGSLELNEQLSLYENISGIELEATPENQIQYQKLYDNLKNYLLENDLDSNKKLSSDELKAYFNKQNLPGYLVNEFLNRYNLNNDGSLDILELMKAHIAFDANKSGVLELNEQMVLNSEISGVDLGATEQNRIQYASLYADLKEKLTQFDLDSNKTLNVNELKNYFASKGYPESAINGLLYLEDHLNKAHESDSEIDLLELMKAYIDVDSNDSGKIEFNEELNLQAKLTGVDLNATTENLIQYTAIYNNLKTIINTYDLSSDKQLNAEELRNYFVKNNLPANLADSLLAKYAVNGNLDLLEWMKAYIDFDANKSGTLDFSELLEYNSQLDGVTLNSSTTNQKQYQALLNSINPSIQSFDRTSDHKLNLSELSQYFVSQGFSASVAAQAINNYDVNKDGSIDAFELLKAYAGVDQNQNGIVDFEDKINMYSNLSGANISVTPDNKAQMNSLWNLATTTINTYDVNKNKELSADEVIKWFNAKGMPQYIAEVFINQYKNSNGTIDMMGLLKAFETADVDKNGALDVNNYLKLYSQLSGIDLFAGYASTTSLSSLYTTASRIFSYDLDKDKRLDATEFSTFLKGQAYTETQIQNAQAKYLTNGYIDVVQWMKTLESFDANKSGILEAAENTALKNSLL